MLDYLAQKKARTLLGMGERQFNKWKYKANNIPFVKRGLHKGRINKAQFCAQYNIPDWALCIENYSLFITVHSIINRAFRRAVKPEVVWDFIINEGMIIYSLDKDKVHVEDAKKIKERFGL